MRSLIKALHVIDSLAPGGAEHVLVELVNGLQEKGVDVGVVITRCDKQLASQLSDDVEVLVLERRHTWDPTAILKMRSYCAEQQISILHAHGRSSLKFCALIKTIAAQKIRLVFHDHYGQIAVDKSADWLLRIVSQKLVDLYIGVAPELQSWAIENLGLARHKTLWLGNAVDLRRFSHVEPLEVRELRGIRQPLLAAIVATLKPQKDQVLLFKAMAQAQRVREMLHVFVVGIDLDDEYSRRCRRAVGELGLHENVTFLGVRNDIPRLLKTVDFGLLSSTSESGPVTLLEYMASEIPFVVTHTGQIAKEVADFGLESVVPPGDAEALSLVLDQLVSLSAQERKCRGKLGKEFLMQHFRIEDRINRLHEIYGLMGQQQLLGDLPAAEAENVW